MIKNIIFDLCGVLFEDTLVAQPRFKPLKEGIEILLALSQAPYGRCYRLFACTNMTEHSAALLKKEHPEIMALFSDIVTSQKAGFKKPDPRIFSFLCSTHDLEPHESLFIDDSQKNVRGASSHGISSIWLQNYKDLKNELIALTIL